MSILINCNLNLIPDDGIRTVKNEYQQICPPGVISIYPIDVNFMFPEIHEQWNYPLICYEYFDPKYIFAKFKKQSLLFDRYAEEMDSQDLSWEIILIAEHVWK